ncbi:hypothetical protein AX17_001345 [Amanita inopinata Kibby_2008]|nr:hypothetical protein AX17_001345 [Amanita inopinata Kibby_2008]
MEFCYPTPCNPTPTPSSSNNADAMPKGKQLSAKVNKRGRLSRARGMEIKQSAVKEAAKKYQKRETLSKTNRSDYSFVFVGNVDSSITVQRIEEYFSQCGKVFRVLLRCSRGRPIGVAQPDAGLTTRDRLYASVEFKDYRGARNAMRLNGTKLDGRKLVVSITPTDLPEVQDIVNSRMTEIMNRKRDDAESAEKTPTK